MSVCWFVNSYPFTYIQFGNCKVPKKIKIHDKIWIAANPANNDTYTLIHLSNTSIPSIDFFIFSINELCKNTLNNFKTLININKSYNELSSINLNLSFLIFLNLLFEKVLMVII